MADTKMLPMFRKKILHQYKQLLNSCYDLEDMSVHNQIINSIDELICNGYKINKAIETVLAKKGYIFDTLFFESSDSDTENDTDSEGDNNTDQDSEHDDGDENDVDDMSAIRTI